MQPNVIWTHAVRFDITSGRLCVGCEYCMHSVLTITYSAASRTLVLYTRGVLLALIIYEATFCVYTIHVLI